MGERSPGSPQSLTLFRVGEDRYAVPATAMIEVVRVPALTPLRQAPGYLVGMADLRGGVVPVLDLCLRLGRPHPPYEISDALLVLEHEGSRLAILISEIIEVVELVAGAIHPAPRFAPTLATAMPQARLLASIVRLDGQLVPLLDLDSLFRLNWPVSPEPGLEDEEAGLPSAPEADFMAQFSPTARGELEQRAAALREGLDDRAAQPHFVALLRLEREIMAVDLLAVRGFAALERITPMPCCPDHILGSMNLRGEVKTTVDPRGLLGLARSEGTPLRQVVVVALPEGQIAVAVHEVVDVVAVDEQAFGRLPSSITAEQRRYCTGTVRTAAGSGWSLVLDLAALLSDPGLVIDEAV